MRTIIRSAFILGALCATPVLAAADPDTKDAKDNATDAKKDTKDAATDAKKKAKDTNATPKQKADNPYGSFVSAATVAALQLTFTFAAFE